jgi:thioesterase domain-containing protein
MLAGGVAGTSVQLRHSPRPPQAGDVSPMLDAMTDTAHAPAHDAARSARLHALETELLAMPPVAAMALRVVDADPDQLRLQAPLAANVNDKGCAFGGSLTSLMTLAGWGLVVLRLAEAGLEAEVFVADSEVRYRAPVYADLDAVARLAEGESWDAFLDTLRSRGRSRVTVDAGVALPEGGMAAHARSRYVAILKG